MNRLLIIFSIGLLISCNSQKDEKTNENSQIIRDTIRIVETVVDTVYVDHSDENDYSTTDYYILERLPERILKSDLINNLELKREFKIENRMNPIYLEADFNGDGNIDIALPIRQVNTGKVGFAIIHGVTNKIHILGAGTEIKNGLSDDMNYIDIWKVNRDKINEPGLEENTGTGEKGELILENPSLQIEKSEVGGGQIYWNGKEYAYFHQTC
jgi:hypothetical protein